MTLNRKFGLTSSCEEANHETKKEDDHQHGQAKALVPEYTLQIPLKVRKKTQSTFK